MAIPIIQDIHIPAWLGHPVGAAQIDNGHDRFGPWALRVKPDPFTGSVSCSLRASNMSFDHGALTFRFSRRTDTFDAAYRVDGGPAYSWRISAMALAAHGVQIQNDDVDNPSGGAVSVPYTALVGGHTIWIRPGPKKAAIAFKIDGLASALAAAKAQACGVNFTGPLSE